MSYTYCFDATNFKEAYQQALIIASQQYFHLNSVGNYNFIGLQELMPLNDEVIPTEYKNLLLKEVNVDELALKTYQDDLIQHLSVA